VVLDDHLRDENAEWRDFGTVEDMARGNVPGKRARCGDVPNDESRWVGGLMPTTVGREPYLGSSSGGGGNSEERQKLALLRGRLKRTHNMIENMLEKEQKERYRQVVLEDKARAAKVARGEDNDDDVHNATFVETLSVTVKGDYEGLMAAERKKMMMEQSHQIGISTMTSSSSKSDEMKYTALNHKWSLTYAILLHGTLQHVQQYAGDYDGSNSNSGEGEDNKWTHSSLEMERRHLHKKLDATTRSSTHKLYVAFTLLEKAARALKFHGIANVTFREAISWLVKFATARDDLKISGVSSGKTKKKDLEHNSSEMRLYLSLFSSSDSDELENLLSSTSLSSAKSSSKKPSSVWNELHRMKQYASLSAAILYVSAKRTGVGRTLAEVCSAFGTFVIGITDGSSEKKRDDGMESLVRPKYCSRAMEELKQAVPDVLAAPVEKAVVLASPPPPPSVPSSCASVASAKEEVSTEPLESESIARVTPDYLPSDMSSTIIHNTNAEESALADLTSRMASSLNLPPSAAVAAIAVATQCKRGGGASHEATTTPSKHIRPRQRQLKGATKYDSDEIIAAASLLLVATAGGIMQRLAEQALNNAQTSSEAQLETFASWSKWNSQPRWHREVSHLEQCTGLPSTNIVACYSNTLHPRRAQLLGLVKQKFELGGEEGDKLLQNIAVAVPLMSLRHI